MRSVVPEFMDRVETLCIRARSNNPSPSLESGILNVQHLILGVLVYYVQSGRPGQASDTS